MPITKSEPPAQEAGGSAPEEIKPEPQPEPEAEALSCLYCRHAVTPCRCASIGGDTTTCEPPFSGYVHIDTGSHLCGFPQPGSAMGMAAVPDEAHSNCLSPDEGHHAIDCPSHPRYQP